jgi:hypothetical protein
VTNIASQLAERFRPLRERLSAHTTALVEMADTTEQALHPLDAHLPSASLQQLRDALAQTKTAAWALDAALDAVVAAAAQLASDFEAEMSRRNTKNRSRH